MLCLLLKQVSHNVVAVSKKSGKNSLPIWPEPDLAGFTKIKGLDEELELKSCTALITKKKSAAEDIVVYTISCSVQHAQL